jgi:hypothetical protein
VPEILPLELLPCGIGLCHLLKCRQLHGTQVFNTNIFSLILQIFTSSFSKPGLAIEELVETCLGPNLQGTNMFCVLEGKCNRETDHAGVASDGHGDQHLWESTGEMILFIVAKGEALLPSER